MVNRRHKRRGDGLFGGRLPALILLNGCFGAGLLFGCIFASGLKQDVNIQLLSYLDGYFSVLKTDGAVRPYFLSTFWEVIRWPLAASVLGTTAFGVLAVPAIFGLRGFLLSYTVSVFILLFGAKGLLFALAVFGLSAILSTVTLFITGVDAFELGCTFVGSIRREAWERTTAKRNLIRHFLVSVCCLAVGAAVQNWVSPIFLNAVADLIINV